MKTAAIVPGVLVRTDDGIPCPPAFDGIDHPRAGALAHARHVFLAGNGLPRRWQHRDAFTVLETSFGWGNHFLATWHAWRGDPIRCSRLTYLAVERHPLSHADMRAAHAASPWRERVDELLKAWPPLTHNLHVIPFDEGRVRLLLAFGDVQAWLPELAAEVDAFYLDGSAPAANPAMWPARVFKALGRLAAPEATLAASAASRDVRAHLTTAGFDGPLGDGFGGDRDVTQARFAPRFAPKRSLARRRPEAPTRKRALVIGAGLAGCASAWALAEHGWDCTLVERRDAPASEGSGNEAGLFHGIVNAQDGAHARFNRAAAMAARAAVVTALREHGAAGGVDGLLRLENELDATQMASMLERLGLPTDYVQAMSAAAASALCGVPLARPAWFYPGGGWVSPGGLARSFLARAGAHATLRCGLFVQQLQRTPSGWALLDAQGLVIDEASTVVIANAADATRLLPHLGWPVHRVRGQISGWPASAGAQPPCTRLPIAGGGYLLPTVNDTVWFGATSQVGDDDPSARDTDHLANLARLGRLTLEPASVALSDLTGRTAWRCSAGDRLPIVGAVPDTSTVTGSVPDQVRFVPRLPGLHVFTALGSRGITWCALGAQVLAAQVARAPVPLEASLLDAIDPARFVVRARRRSDAG